MNSNSENGQGLPFIAAFCGIFFLVKVWERVSPLVDGLWARHRFPVVIVLVACLSFAVVLLIAHLWNQSLSKNMEAAITALDETAAPLGKEEKGQEFFLKQTFRTSHTQIIGTTSAGKTESVILPWIIKDIENGSGMLVIDGKSDVSFLRKLYGYVKQNGREEHFKLCSLSNVSASHPFNPLQEGSPQEIVERVFSSFPFENEYYRNVQYKIFLALITLIHERDITPSLRLVHRLLTDVEYLKAWIAGVKDEGLRRTLTAFASEPNKERNEKISGLDSHLSHFCSGDVSLLFEINSQSIRFDQALEKGQICYFQLPTMYYPFLGEACGKLVLQCFQSAVAKRHLGLASKPNFFACYLDDFQDYIYPGFGALLNKSRSANIGVVFSHQALGDLDKVGPAFRNIVTSNTNVKVVMRNNDPDTCEFFARSFGTKSTEKVTERRKKDFWGETKTGDGSLREVEEFVFHPKVFKQLEIGQAVVSIPHARGVKIAKTKFTPRPDIDGGKLAPIAKKLSELPLPPGSSFQTPKPF